MYARIQLKQAYFVFNFNYSSRLAENIIMSPTYVALAFSIGAVKPVIWVILLLLGLWGCSLIYELIIRRHVIGREVLHMRATLLFFGQLAFWGMLVLVMSNMKLM